MHWPAAMRFNGNALGRFSEEPPPSGRGSNDHFFLDDDAKIDPLVKGLQDKIRQQVPAIRDHLQRTLGDDSKWPDYVDRLYHRARNALLTASDLDDQAIWRRFISLVHEDRRMERKRFGGIAEIRLAKTADPESTSFVSDLARRDQLRAFRECLDDWMKNAFDFRFATPEPKSSKEMAKAFGMKANTFDQRWSRGLAAGREEYRRRHGNPMP